MKQKFFKIFLTLVVALGLTGQGCTRGVSQEVQKASMPVVLNWWSPFLTTESVRPLIDAYRTVHPNVTINFRRIRIEDYEKELVNALAEDRGPDIFSLHNTWISGWRSKLAPMPASVKLPYQEVKTTLGIKKEIITTLRTTQTLGIKGLAANFVDAVAADVLFASEDPGSASMIYALPLSLDTMAMYYNKDLLNLAGIPTPPRTWTELQGIVKRLTKIDPEGKIVQAGAALGGSRNVERSADIVALLMMQNGSEMIDEARRQAVFDRLPSTLRGRALAPGEEALVFYADFANPGKEVYTWSDALPNSLQAFAAGKAAIFFGYSYQMPAIKNLAPKLNFEVAPMPQIEGNSEVNFANYWVEGVSRKSAQKAFAWDFVQFATVGRTGPNQASYLAEQYLTIAKKPTALRALVVKQSDDLEIGVFAAQALTAKSWYRGNDAHAAEAVFLDMIDQARSGTVDPDDALRLAAQKVNQTLK